jgi:RimJ/RimL family protein N-acetyltransferase
MTKTSIRRLVKDDFNLVFDWENREELWEISDESGPFSTLQIQRFMDRCLANPPEDIERWIVENEEGYPIGMVDLFDIDRTLKSGGIGILIADQHNRRLGHARRALTLVLSILKEEKWTFIRALIHEENSASRFLFGRLHFSQGARTFHRGKPAFQYVCALSEWKP